MTDAEGVRAAWGRGDITPEPGIHMGGYWGRTSGARSIHDPLSARVLVVAGEEVRVCLVALDLVALEAATVADVRARILEVAGIPGEAVMICSTHTHAGPLTLGFRGMGEVDAAYLQGVVTTIAATVAAALSDLRPVTLSHSRVPARLGINRRQQGRQGVVIGENPDGPVAAYAHVIRFSGDDDRSCVLFSHACHPVVLGNDNHSISAEFSGAAVRWVEREAAVFAMFVNGACGDINPRRTGGTFEDVEALGDELGRAVVAGLDEAERLPASPVSYANEKVGLPLIDPPPRAQIAVEKLVLKARALIVKMAADDYWSQLVARARLQWAEDMHELVRSGAKSLMQPFEVQAIRIGELALLGLEGEMFVRYQLELEAASPWTATAVMGYANGCIGYVPTADEYERGGYEVGTSYDFRLDASTEAYKVYPSVQMIAPESEEIIRSTALRLLQGLVKAGQQ